MGEDLCSTENKFSLPSYPSTCKHQQIRNGLGILLFQHEKKSIIKSSTDIDNKELFPISGSSSQKVWKSSDSDNEDVEENIDTDDPDTSD